MVVPVQPKVTAYALGALALPVGHAWKTNVTRQHSDPVPAAAQALYDVSAGQLVAAEVMRRVHVGQHQQSHVTARA